MLNFGGGQYWEHARWVPVNMLVNEWSKADGGSRTTKRGAILTACERGEIECSRSDGKSWSESIDELYAKGVLMVSKSSFLAWVAQSHGNKAAVEQLATREKNNLHLIIGGLLFLLLSDGKTRRNQSGVISELLELFEGMEPFSKSGLEKRIPEVKEALKVKGFDFDGRLKAE